MTEIYAILLFTRVYLQKGFVSAILLLINLLIGVGALYASKLRFIIRPVITKFAHNALGIATLVFGMVSLYYGYYTEYIRTEMSPEATTLMAALTIATTVLSCIGALKSLLHQGKDVAKQAHKTIRSILYGYESNA